MNENWIVKIQDQPDKITKAIFIFRHNGDGSDVIQADGMIKRYRRGDAWLPTLEVYPEILQALAEELDQKGFKPKEGFMEGKMMATEKHLEDMRDLVFKDWPVKIVEVKEDSEGRGKKK